MPKLSFKTLHKQIKWLLCVAETPVNFLATNALRDWFTARFLKSNLSRRQGCLGISM